MDKFFSFNNRVTESLKQYGLNLGKILVIIVSFIIILFALLAFLQFGFIYAIYAVVENWVSGRLGFDFYISTLIATVFTSLFALLIPTLCWYIFLGKRKAWGIGTIIGIQVLICLSIYTIGKNVCFDRKTGKPLCHFADTTKGRVWSYTPGFDPVSGKEFRLYTREIREAEEIKKLKTNK